MSAPLDSDTTLLTEHFSYRPAALIDDIINSINTLAYRCLDMVEDGLLKASPSSLGIQIPSNSSPSGSSKIEENLKHEIENGVHQLETLLEAKIDKNFDKMELYALRNIFSVPAEVRDWVRLSHYEGLEFPQHLDADAPTLESVQLQRRKLRETQKLHALLLAETERNEATIRSLRGLVSKQVPKQEPGEDGKEEEVYPAFAFLQDKGELSGDNVRPVSTTTSFALSQLPALKALLERLQARLKELANGNAKEGLVGEEEKSWRRQRLEFVERETRRHLESVRGLELGEMGEVRDGEWQGEGRKLGKGEVEDLEKMVEMIGNGDAMDES